MLLDGTDRCHGAMLSVRPESEPCGSSPVTGAYAKHPSLTSEILGADGLEHCNIACEGASISASLALSTEHDEVCSGQSIHFGLQRLLAFADGKTMMAGDVEISLGGTLWRTSESTDFSVSSKPCGR